MGFFDTRKVTTVGTAATRLIKDNNTPDATKSGLTKYIRDSHSSHNDSAISDYVTEDLVNGLATRAERMFNYGKNKYIHGLPAAKIVMRDHARTEIQSVIETLEGGPVTLHYAYIGPPNSLHIAWMKLIADHGYNPVTNRLGNLSTLLKDDIYMVDIEIRLVAAQASQIHPETVKGWGMAPRAKDMAHLTDAARMLVTHNLPIADPLVAEDVIRVLYRGANAGNYNFDMPLLGGYVADETFAHAHYTTAGGVPKYWMYQLQSGLYPTIDAKYDTPYSGLGTYFPFAYFRYSKQSTVDDKTTEDYKSSKRLLKYLDLRYDDIGKAINENPDIKDVEQAMMIMAVPCDTTNPEEQRYLFEYFSALQASGALEPVQMTLDRTTGYYATPSHDEGAIVLQDKRFKMTLRNAGILRRYKTGTVAKVGEYTSAKEKKDYFIPWSSYDENSNLVEGYMNWPRSVFYYRKQVTAGLYEEIMVVAPEVLYHVYGKYFVTAGESEKGEQYPILLIPLDHAISSQFSMPVREKLYARSLHFVFNSRVVTKVKWYQTSFFQWIVMVIAVVIAMYTGNGAFIDFAVGFFAGTLTAAVIQAFIMELLKTLLISLVIKLVVKIIGPKLAFLAAVVAMAYGYGKALMSDAASVTAALTGTFAGNLVMVANGLIKASAQYYADALDGLKSDFKALNALQEQRTKDLETAQKLLETDNRYAPMLVLGESPTQYFDRTVHSGNIGIIGIEAVTNFVDMSLLLPRTTESDSEYSEYGGNEA